MAPKTPTRNRSKTHSASPPAIRTPLPSIRSEKSYSDDWWMDQEREQQGLSVKSRHNRPTDSLMDEAERMNLDVGIRNQPTTPVSWLLRRGHASLDTTSSELNHYTADSSSLAEQGSTATVLESTITMFEDDESQSDYGSEQENQPPTDVPTTPPNEPTYHRLQRRPLRQLTIDRNGNLLIASPNIAENSPSFPGRLFANSSQIDEDGELNSDTESNASTIVLPNSRKRNVGDFEEDGKRHKGRNGNHTVGSRPTKRLKTSSRQERVDGAEVHPNNMHTHAKLAGAISLTYTTPSGRGSIEESDSQSTASTIVPSPRKRRTTHRERRGEEDGSPRMKMRKRRRALSTGALAPGSPGLGKQRSQQESEIFTSNRSRREERRNFSMPAIGRKQDTLDSSALDSFSNQEPIHSTQVRPQNRYTGTPLPAHRVWLPTPAKTPVADSTRYPVAAAETNTTTDNILTRLKAAEVCFTRWLTEVRNKKDRYRRLLAQQKEDQRLIEEDMTRLRQLEPIIQTMAIKEMDEIDENIRMHEGDAEKLSAQRKEIRQRLLGFEKLRPDFEGERLAEV